MSSLLIPFADKLPKDLRAAAATLGSAEARFLVDTYYTVQKSRVATNNQVKGLIREGSEEPHETLTFFMAQMALLENAIKAALDRYSAASELGQWARGQKGIGPVLAAGLLAHIDLAVCPTVGHIWNFAGLNPDVEWGKGEKRPWNGQLKTLCWKIGDSFMKVSGREDAYYGALYASRKQYEIARNEEVMELPEEIHPDEAGGSTRAVTLDGELHTAYLIGGRWFTKGNAKAAHRSLTTKKFGKTTEAYKAYTQGRIPEAQILARAKRYATKLFLAHYHEVGRKLLGLDVPNPYPIAHLGHTHYMAPPS